MQANFIGICFQVLIDTDLNEVRFDDGVNDAVFGIASLTRYPPTVARSRLPSSIISPSRRCARMRITVASASRFLSIPASARVGGLDIGVLDTPISGTRPAGA